MLSSAGTWTSWEVATAEIDTTVTTVDAVATTETTRIFSEPSSSDNVDGSDGDTQNPEAESVIAASGERKTSPSVGERDCCISLEDLNSRTSSLIYNTLKPGEIRIIKLHQGERDSPIQCSLSTFEQANAPDYEALSYVWGAQTELDEILLDGEAYKITQNLGEAMLQLRSTDHDRLLWIDASRT
jgi:hypothetical protein